MNLPRWLLLMFVLGSSPEAYAFYCFEPSPTFLRMGDAYFDDTSERITVTGEESGIEVLRNLRGEWEGHLSELSCEGTDEAPDAYYDEAEVEAEVRESNTALFLLSLSKEYEHSYLIDGDKIFLMNLGSMYALRISPEHVSASERERRAWYGYRPGSRYVEVFSDITIHNPDEITVEWQTFSNGYFVYSQRLELHRD